jgi:hypothetical protein
LATGEYPMTEVEDPREKVKIFKRDRWHCRWCQRPVIFALAMKYMQYELKDSGNDRPIAYYDAHWDRQASPLLDELGAIARREGYTACNRCHVTDECKRPVQSSDNDARSSDWDGLSQYFVLIAARQASSLSTRDRRFLEALEAP